MSYHPLAEILIRIPDSVNSKYTWTVYVPGEPELILYGDGLDYEYCWQKALNARDYLQKHGSVGDRLQHKF